MLTIWPPMPIIIWEDDLLACNEDNIVATLEHDRVCDIQLSGGPSLLLEKLLATMQEPFPALAYLELDKNDIAPVIPDSFLGGFAPDLKELSLIGIPISFAGLRKVLLSATDLAILSLSNIPHSGYFSPEAIVTCLSALTRLKILDFWI